jgi:hypothetical protein
MTSQSTHSILQIPLYKYWDISNSSIFQTIVLSIIGATLICTAIYFLFNIRALLLHLSIGSLVVINVLVIKYINYLFPPSDTTLVLAYGELRLMKNDKIEAFEKTKDILTSRVHHINIPTIQLIGDDFPKMTIGYFYRKRDWQIEKATESIDFIIYKKTDWTQLQTQLEIEPAEQSMAFQFK